MDNVVNLNKFRKARAKDVKEQKATENRRKHGRTKAEMAAGKARSDKDKAGHDGHRLEDSDDKEPA